MINTATPKKGIKKKKKTIKDKSNKTFRIAARNILLTYPQCNIPVEDAVTQIRKKLDDYGVEEFIGATEKHEDGNKHLHIFVQLGRKADIRRQNFLDISYENKEFHGNYKVVNSKQKTIEYIIKDIMYSQVKDLKTWEEAKDFLVLSPGINDSIGLDLRVLSLEEKMIDMSRKGRVQEALTLLEREDPKKFLTQGTAIERRLKEIQFKQIGIKRRFSFESFKIPPQLKKALEMFKKSIDNDEVKTLVVKGKPGCGKTQALLAYLEEVLQTNVLIINDADAIRYFDPTIHGSILFDDVDLSHLSRETLINLLDNLEKIFKVRYGHSVMEANLPKALTTNVVLTNINPFFNIEDEAIARRIIFVTLDENDVLFHKNNENNPLTLEEIDQNKKAEEFRQECDEFRQEEKRLALSRKKDNASKDKFMSDWDYKLLVSIDKSGYNEKYTYDVITINPDKCVNPNFINFLNTQQHFKDGSWIYEFDRKRQEIFYDVYKDEESDVRYEKEDVKKARYIERVKVLEEQYEKNLRMFHDLKSSKLIVPRSIL